MADLATNILGAEGGDPKKGSDEDILSSARKYLQQCISDEGAEREKMLDDLRFCTLDQWPKDIRNDRENDIENGPRPCLTIDKINQYIVQVVNDMRQGKPGVNVRPMNDDAAVETAKVLKGLVRHIEDQSNADIAYMVAGESAAKIGLGFFRITTRYVDDDSFDQEIFIDPIPNTFSVYLGPHIMPDGSDADRGYVVDTMPVAKFHAEFPDAKYGTDDFDGLQDTLGYWRREELITVIEEYKITRTRDVLLFLADGTTMSQADYDKWPEEAGQKPTVQDERVRMKSQLQWRKMTGIEILDKRDLPGKYIPIVEVVGRESHVNGQRILWGLVRPAKDSLRMYNYFASTVTEKMGLAPKTPFIGARGQFEGLEGKWKQANRTNYAYLEYNPIDVNGNAVPAPQRVGVTPMEAALLHQMQVIEHDVQTSLGMFQASVGETESQQSGKALLALGRRSDTGTYHFGANQGVSIRHAGRIIVDMIPHYYDTKRTIRILGDDGQPQAVHIDPSQPMAHRQVQTSTGIQSIHNPGVGEYDVSIEVGPSYTTQRLEAATVFTELAKGATDPGSAAVLRYLTVQNSDFAKSDEAANMLRSLLPPPVLQAMQPNQQIPPAAQAEIQKVNQALQIADQHVKVLTNEVQQLKSGQQIDMAKIQANAAAEKEAHVLKVAQADSEHQLKIQIADKDRELSIYKARLDAATKVTVAEIAAKGALAQTAVQAESDANLALSQDLKPDGAMPAPDEPTTPIAKLAQMHKETHAQTLQMMQAMLEAHHASTEAIVAHLAKPRTVQLGGIKHAPDGSILGASATLQ